MNGYKAQAYRGNQINTAGPLGLILLSYDALYKSLGRAAHAIDGGDLAAEADHTARALEAIIELSESLNFEVGGEVAQDLSVLYAYMMKRLTDGMCTCSPAAIEEVMGLVLTLREGWEGLSQNQAPQQQSSSYAAASYASPRPSSAYASTLSYG